MSAGPGEPARILLCGVSWVVLFPEGQRGGSVDLSSRGAPVGPLSPLPSWVGQQEGLSFRFPGTAQDPPHSLGTPPFTLS